jgi:hypothetical protein
MLAQFILSLREAGVPASLTEYLTMLGGMKAGVCDYGVEDFYFLARASLVKDERHLDRFDQVFATCFKGIETPDGPAARELPEEWLRKLAEKLFTDEEKAKVKDWGGFEKLMEALRERLETQKRRYQGSSKMIGTAGDSPFGAWGYNPEGIRIGQDESRHRRAIKVWDERAFRDLDDTVELNTRSLKLGLRRLRRFARQGAATELDVPGTVRATAGNAGMLDLRMVAERRNTVKVLLLFDIGGSMDDHVRECEELFSAARSEFKHMESFYFHNCPYERLWKTNARGREGMVPTEQVMRTYGPDYRLILVGDATMSPYEIVMAGGSVEHWNAESGQVWLSRLIAHYRRSAWINPVSRKHWDHTQSVQLVHELMEARMYPLTLEGLAEMTTELTH